MTTRIHQTVYAGEPSDPAGDRPGALEYRVLLERDVIKDWTEGDVAQYFGLISTDRVRTGRAQDHHRPLDRILRPLQRAALLAGKSSPLSS
jgi:hypothetical protein